MEVHIVVKGDTLWKIARQYGIPFEDLKRVNAHLANPDYIVPGMKIFLPKRQHNAEHPEKGKGPVTPHPPKGTKPSPPIPVPKPPTSKPSTPKPPIPIPPAPAPRPPTPTPPAPTPRPPTPVPPSKPKPPPAVSPTVPAPIPLPTPTLPPTSMPTPMPMPMHPMIGIPCGWMPIFDADCFPFMHSGQIQAMPRPEPPMALPSTQFPMYEQESPIFSGQGPATSPLGIPMVEGWQLLESPDFMFEETAEMVMQPAAECSPEFMHVESPEFDLQPSVPCPPGPGYVPQAISPAVQGQWNPGQFGFPSMPHPGHHQGCGCGCDGPQHHQHHRQQMMIPIFYGHPCNCPSCMQQATPYSGMPPNQGSNWFGAY